MSYLQSIMKQYPPITFEEERKMIADYESRGDIKGLKDQLVMRNVGVMWTIAKRYRFAYEIDDLIGIGINALYKAVEEFDTKFGVRFSTYCGRVLQTIFTRTMKNYYSDIDKNKVSMNAPVCGEDGDDGTEISELIQDKIPSELGITKKCNGVEIKSELSDQLLRFVKTDSDKKLYDVTRMNICEGKTLREIGDNMHISRERVRQMVSKFLFKNVMPSYRKIAERMLKGEKPKFTNENGHWENGFYTYNVNSYYTNYDKWIRKTEKLAMSLLKKELIGC